jgi:ABC-type sugar transport system ATPase subunit
VESGGPRPAVFVAEGLSKRFGSVVALEGVDLAIYPGEILGLLGDNGAGKSTFVKLASGVYRPSSGRILFEGKPANFHSAADARHAGIETVHQDLGLIDSMSIARNFFLGAELRWGPFLRLARMQAETREILTEIGLQNLRDAGQDVSRLSGGERQAISIGRAVAFQKKMIILDEPTSALSVKETDKVFDYMRKAKDRGLAVVAVMHNLAQIAAVADRFVVFWHGRKTADFANAGQSETDLAQYIHLGALPSVDAH